MTIDQKNVVIAENLFDSDPSLEVVKLFLTTQHQ